MKCQRQANFIFFKEVEGIYLTDLEALSPSSIMPSLGRTSWQIREYLGRKRLQLEMEAL
jgi:hypothetical protein